ncbi:MAG: glutathione peroxidase [Myxococcota bacterium]
MFTDNQDQGFTVLAFPCNQFGGQEPGTNEEILRFATSKYNANFPMFAKIDVNGPSASPIYTFLKDNAPENTGADISWNFTKFLVGRAGAVLARFEPRVTPEEIAAKLPDFL